MSTHTTTEARAEPTRLQRASLSLFMARYCGNHSAVERRLRIEQAKGELIRAVRAWRFSGIRTQRELINRRQLRASLAGVELYNRKTLFGHSLGFRKWA